MHELDVDRIPPDGIDEVLLVGVGLDDAGTDLGRVRRDAVADERVKRLGLRHGGRRAGRARDADRVRPISCAVHVERVEAAARQGEECAVSVAYAVVMTNPSGSNKVTLKLPLICALLGMTS